MEIGTGDLVAERRTADVGMDLVAEHTVVGTHNSVADTEMLGIGSGPFVRAIATAYVVAPVALDVVVVAVAVLSSVAAAARLSLDSSDGRGS